MDTSLKHRFGFVDSNSGSGLKIWSERWLKFGFEPESDSYFGS